MTDTANKQKMFEFMLEMCGQGMSAEEKSKWKERMEACFNTMVTRKSGSKEVDRDMLAGIMSCCGQMDPCACMPSCCAGTDTEKKHD